MSSEQKHTPGPWVGFSEGSKVIAIMPAGRLGDICVFRYSPSDADASLMIAAPELLASCVEFLPILERQLESINPGGAAEASAAFQFAKARVDRMRAAISKASPLNGGRETTPGRTQTRPPDSIERR